MVIISGVVKKNEEFFRTFMDQSQIRGVYSIGAAHGMITDFYGGPCSIANGFFLNNCDYNQAHDILKTLHPNENVKIPAQGAETTGTVRFKIVFLCMYIFFLFSSLLSLIKANFLPGLHHLS